MEVLLHRELTIDILDKIIICAFVIYVTVKGIIVPIDPTRKRVKGMYLPPRNVKNIPSVIKTTAKKM